MLLAVDVGNTQTHLGAFEGAELGRDWRLTTVPSATADELAATISDLLQLEGLGFDRLDGAIVSTVVPQLGPEWERLCSERTSGGACLIVGPQPEDRDADPGRQPPRARGGPPRQRGRRAREGEGRLRGGRLRHLDQLRRRLRARASTSAA